MKNTKQQPIEELKQIADEAKAEVERLRGEIAAGPQRVADVERRLNSATDGDTARMLIEQRAKLREDREVNIAALKGAEIAALRTESAYLRACAESTPGLAEAIEEDKQAKAALEAATERAKLAGKARGRIEMSIGELTSRATKLSLQADALEGKKPQM